MSTQSLTLAELNKGEIGIVEEGKFEGREFTVASKGTQGRFVLVQWTDKGTKGSVSAATAVRVTR
jgi:hypothetical protein